MSPTIAPTVSPPLPPPKKVVFVGVQKGYLHTQDIVFDVDYAPSTTVSPKDWIAILPAGYTHLAHFAAFKTAPAKQVICGSKDAPEDGKNIVSDDCGQSSRPRDSDAVANRPIRVVFRAKEARLPPRNFYQIVYVQGHSRAVIGSSSVFYVERALGRMPEAKHKMVVVAEDRVSACMLRNLFCGVAGGAEATPKASETKSALLIDDDEEEAEEEVATQQPLCDQAPGAYECIKRYVTEVLRQPFGSAEPDRSASMYEIGSFGGSMNNNIETKSVHDHYQKLIAQLTMSNSSLHRENEMLKSQVQRMSMQLQDHIDHLSSVYYSMHKYGYTALELPDGDRVNLAKYHGMMLNFVGGYSPPHHPNSKKHLEINDLNDLADSISKRKTTFPTEKEELKTAMLKCLTKSPKKSDVDDYVNWLNDNSTPRTPPKPLKQLQFVENVLAQCANGDRASRRDRQVSEEAPKAVRFTPPADPTTSTQPENKTEASSAKPKANGTAKTTKNGKHRASSVSSKSTGFAGAHKLSSGTKSSGAPRRSLANLSYMRTTSRSPRRNLL
ncbi:hypothetical protein QR680_017109 [Steinernema hermaphroditum]|uniref:Uncharacterized protein n=1 Tax=Steinernema hermaphroditum TaxID=289476 RepID=A0AA39HDU6_9BILA|nr:hypothetical protein QR680_017109 [Steinernema hermaphroditum]